MDIRMSNIASPMPQIRAKFTNKLGTPLSGCRVYTYEPNSDIPKTTWLDIDKTVENTNPILLDAAGEADIFIDGLYRVVVRDRFGFVVYDVEKTGSHAQWDALFITDGDENQHEINSKTIRRIGSISDLFTISNPKNGQVVYVESLQKNYIYNSTNTYTPNGVTVVDKWEMETQDAYYASWFATPNVVSDQSLKLQAGHDYATYKNKPFIVDGVFHVEANQTYQSIENNAFIVRDYSKITFLPNAKFIQINQNKNQSNVVLMMRTKGAALIRPVGVGDRLQNMSLGSHTSDAQGYGYGLTIYETDGCYIFEPNFSQNHGDNIYIGKPWGSNQEGAPKDTTIVRPIVHHARRNCISLTAWDNVKIIDPIMSYGGDSDGITGAFPKSCLDVELEEAEGFALSQGVRGLITNPTFLNSSNGLLFYCAHNNRSFDIAIEGTSKFDNINTIAIGAYYAGLNCTGKVFINDVDIAGNPYIDLSIGWQKSDLPFIIDRFEPRRGSALISSLLNGITGSAYTTKVLGNVTIRNLITKSFSTFLADIGDTTAVRGYSGMSISGYKFLAPSDSVGISVYSNDLATQAKFGADTVIDSKNLYAHTGFSINTLKMPNDIWQTPPDDVTAVFLNVSGDYRTLKIGLSYNGRVGQGCNIQGLNLLISGVAKTTMRTLTPGGWVKFKNVSGGRTQILDMFGDWSYG